MKTNPIAPVLQICLLAYHSPLRLYILQLSDREMEVIQMSKRKILKTVEQVLSVILSAAKTIEKMGRVTEPDNKTKRKK